MIGEEVRRRREETGLTGAQLAERAGLAPSAVSQIETGKRSPSSTSIIKLATALGVEPGDLFPLDEPPLLSREVLEEAKQQRVATWDAYGGGEGCGTSEGSGEHISANLANPKVREQLLDGPRSELDRALTVLLAENRRLKEELLAQGRH
jgi:transcriptional regulator with XRE-family HTH domain